MNDHTFQIVRVAAWLICLGSLLPAVWRICTRKSRYLDPIWLVVALLAVNRLIYVSGASAMTAHISSVTLALTMAFLATWYQRHDHR